MFFTQVFLIALRVFLRFMTLFFVFCFFLVAFSGVTLFSLGDGGGTGKFDRHGGLVLLIFQNRRSAGDKGVTGWVPQFL